VTLAEVTGPGGETPSAPDFSVPAFSLRYHLDRRDALVWETLPAELSGPQKAISIGFLVAGGMGYGIAAEHLPDWINNLPYILVLLLIVGVMHGLWRVCDHLLKRHRARKRLPRRVYCVFEDWGDHIYIQSELEEVALSADLCRQTVVTPTHLFMDFVDTLVIVPTAAFDSVTQMTAFIGKWEGLANEAAY
jgi:hypothetical protein